MTTATVFSMVSRLRLQGDCLIDSVYWLRPELIFIVQIIVWSKPAMVSFWEMCSLNLPLIQAGFSLLHWRKAFCLKPITLPSTPSQGIRAAVSFYTLSFSAILSLQFLVHNILFPPPKLSPSGVFSCFSTFSFPSFFFCVRLFFASVLSTHSHHCTPSLLFFFLPFVVLDLFITGCLFLNYRCGCCFNKKKKKSPLSLLMSPCSHPARPRSVCTSCPSSQPWMSCTSCPSTLAALRASQMMTAAGARPTSVLALEVLGKRSKWGVFPLGAGRTSQLLTYNVTFTHGNKCPDTKHSWFII